MADFEHLRHKPPTPLDQPPQLVLVLAPLRSAINLSRIVRLAGCAGLQRIIQCGPGRVDPSVARDALEQVTIERRSSLPPVLKRLAGEGYHLVGLEQTTGSQSLYDYAFRQRTALVIGNERTGLESDALQLLDAVVEIPVYGRPLSYNVATATAMAVYEYSRQWAPGRQS
jgi:tRNA G18 (ribose-2'-O)-methylase SpoU